MSHTSVFSDDPTAELQAAIAKVDSNLAELRREGALIKLYDKRLGSQMESGVADVMESFANILKIAVAQPNDAIRPLSHLRNEIEKLRARCLEQFLKQSAAGIRRTLTSPFSIGSQTSVLSDLDDLERSIDSSTLSSLPMNESLNSLSSALKQFEEIERQLDRERQMSKRRNPIKTILWGLPIWIGIAFSGRLGLLGNFVCFLVLIAAAALSYFLANRKTISSDTQKRSASNVLSLVRSGWVPILIGLLAIASAFFTTSGGQKLADLLTKDSAILESETAIEGRPGDVVQSRLTIGPTQGVLYAVSVRVDSPLVKDQSVPKLVAIVSPSTPVPLEFTIAPEAPAGDYRANLWLSYEVESRWFFYSGNLTKTRKVPFSLRVTDKEQ